MNKFTQIYIHLKWIYVSVYFIYTDKIYCKKYKEL